MPSPGAIFHLLGQDLLRSSDSCVGKIDNGSKNNDDNDDHGYEAALIVFKAFHSLSIIWVLRKWHKHTRGDRLEETPAVCVGQLLEQVALLAAKFGGRIDDDSDNVSTAAATAQVRYAVLA